MVAGVDLTAVEWLGFRQRQASMGSSGGCLGGSLRHNDAGGASDWSGGGYLIRILASNG